MSNTIFDNEKRTIDTILEKIRKEGEDTTDKRKYMPYMMNVYSESKDRVPQNLYRSYSYKSSEDSKTIELIENDAVAELHCVFDDRGFSRAIIIYDKVHEQYFYYLNVNNELAKVSKKGAEFYFIDDKKYVRTLPESEEKPTVLETIESTLPTYAGVDNPTKVFNAFKEIIALDTTRDVKPLTDQELEIAILKDKVKELEASNERKLPIVINAQRIKDENGRLTEDNARLKEENARLTEDNARLQAEKEEQGTQITKLQAMLGRTLKFAEKVRNSVFGRVLFNNQLKELSIDGQSLPEGTSIDETDSVR